MNKLILIGNLGADPETRVTTSGLTVTNLRVATTERHNGNDDTEWHQVVLFDKQAEVARDYLRKGSKVAIEGRIQTEKWTDKEGRDRYTTKVLAHRMELIDRKPADAEPRRQEPARRPEPAGADPFNDDVPF